MRGLFLCLALLLLSIPASAQDALERARVAFEQGVAAYEAGQFEAALAHFQEAHGLTQNPDILFNIGTVADRLRRDDVALEAYRGYLRERPDSSDRAQIEARVRVLEQELAEREAREREEQERADEGSPPSAPQPAPTREAPPPSDVGPAPWIIAGTGAALAIGGVIMIIVAELDSACVTAPSGCVENPSAPRWEEVAASYDRIPVLQGVGGALIGVGAAAAVLGLVWGLGGGGSTEVAIGPGRVSVRGTF